MNDMYDWTGYLKNLNVGGNYPFANTKLAIVGSNSNDKDPGRRREWLKCIIENMQATAPGITHNVDAITIHDYFGAGSIGFTGTTPLMNNEDVKCMINLAYTTTQDLFENEFKDIVTKTGKEIWMTEYNLFDRNDFSVHGTWAHGLTIALKSLRYIEEPNVTKLCMHTMTGDGGWASFFSDGNGLTPNGMQPFTAPVSPCNNINTSITHELTAIGNALQLLSYAIKNSTTAQPLDFTNNTNTLSIFNNSTAYPDIYGWQFDALDAERFIILNLSDAIRTMDMNAIITAPGQPQMTSYFPDNTNAFKASGGIAGDAMDAPTDECFLKRLIDPTVDVTNFNIPPWGMVLITASKNTLIAKPTANVICEGSQTSVMVYNWDFNPMVQNFYSSFGTLTTVPNCPGLFNFDPNGQTGTAYLTFENLGIPATVTTQITVQLRPTITIAPTSGTYCTSGGTPITLTATTSAIPANPIVLWGPNWGLNNPSGKIVTATPHFNTTYNAYIYDGVCFNESNPAIIAVPRFEIANAGQKFITCNNGSAVNLLKIEPQIDISNCIGCAYSYQWSTLATTTSISLNPTSSATYTVTVTATNATCTSTATASYTVEANNCCIATSPNVALSPTITPGGLLQNNNVDDLETALTNINCGCITTANGVTTVTDNGTLGTIFINGHFAVNKNLTLINCTVRFGENAEVVVANDKSLILEGCDIQGCSPAMWRGLIGNTNNANIIIKENVATRGHVEDALAAVQLSNDANFRIQNTDFVNNHISINFENYTKSLRGHLHQANANVNGNSYINGCTFNSTPADMLLPYTSQYSYSHIACKNMPYLLIGYATNSAITNNLFKNTYSNSHLGINSINSTIQVVNSTFTNTQKLNSTFATNNGIRATSIFDCNDRSIIIGGDFKNATFLDQCTFSNWEYAGIYASEEMNVDVRHCNFSTNDFADIMTNKLGTKTLHVANNNFTTFNHAIANFNAPNMNTNYLIDNNTFSNYNTAGTGGFYGSAVLLMNVGTSINAPPRSLVITNNTITNPRIGIVVLNHNFAHIGFDPIAKLLAPNTITFNLTNPPADYTAGMLLQNCGNARVTANTITNNTALTGITNFNGIDAELCSDGRFNCNTINRIPYSFRFYGNCNKTLLRSNSMTNYDEAMHLESATLPDQYQVNDNTGDNEPWIMWNDMPNTSGTPADRVVGTGGLINWYHQPGTPGSNPFDPLDNGTTSPIVNSISDAAAIPPVACEDFTERHGRDAAYGRTVGDSLLFDEYANENSWLARMNAYTDMKTDSTIINQGNSADAYYQQFFDEVAQTNIGALAAVNELTADSTNLATAQAVNTAIVDTNNIEYYNKTVNDIYINTYANDNLPNEMDSSMLDMISSLNFYEAGDAIYQAAAMLGKEIHPQCVAMRKAKPLPVEIPVDNTLHCYQIRQIHFLHLLGTIKILKKLHY
nr:hypothetical protein [Bacteroidota bacterium]